MGLFGVKNDIKGPWSKPVDLKVSGIDPGHIVDKQGNRYLYVDKGEVIRLTEDGLSTIGKKQKVYEGWLYPDKWDTECDPDKLDDSIVESMDCSEYKFRSGRKWSLIMCRFFCMKL